MCVGSLKCLGEGINTRHGVNSSYAAWMDCPYSHMHGVYTIFSQTSAEYIVTVPHI